ncbi:MAG TPA: hypothetical protein VNM16_07095 [Bacillota bacterium]|nr:hypothetical protein [Bacillota bacterium]
MAARWFASGRQALAFLLATALPRGARVLCPAAICASVPAALAAAGAKPVFYAQDLALNPVWEGMPEGDALLLVHPLGRLLQVPPLSGLTLIEDFTQTLLNRRPRLGLGLGFASLRKLLPVPDGGVAVGALPPGPEPVDDPSPFVRMRMANDPAAEDMLDAWSGPPEPIWRETLSRLRSLDHAALRRARRQRYRVIEQMTLNLHGVRRYWPALPDGVAPLAVPVLCRNRHDLRRRLVAAGIRAEPYWPVLPESRAAASAQLRLLVGTLLLIPCDPSIPLERLRGALDNIRVPH